MFVTRQTELTPEQHKRLHEIGDFLSTARELHLATFDITDRPGSQAAEDFATDQFCEVTEPGKIAKPWPRETLKDPRGLAVNLTHQAAIHLDALGLLYQTDRFEDVPGTVARAAFEFICRAVWILDPKVTHRVRCARQQLTDLSSFDEWRKARKPSIAPADRDAESKKLAKVRKDAIVELTKRFATEIDEKGKLVLPTQEKSGLPILAGQTYLMFTDLAEHFGTAAGLAVSGRELYDLMALGAHPQGFPGFNGMLVDLGDGVTQRKIDYVQLERLAGAVAPAFHEAVGCVLSYHGDHQNQALKGWATGLISSCPGRSSHSRGSAPRDLSLRHHSVCDTASVHNHDLLVGLQRRERSRQHADVHRHAQDRHAHQHPAGHRHGIRHSGVLSAVAPVDESVAQPGRRPVPCQVGVLKLRASDREPQDSDQPVREPPALGRAAGARAAGEADAGAHLCRPLRRRLPRALRRVPVPDAA